MKNSERQVEWVDPTRLFGDILIELAERDDAIVLVTADSFRNVENFVTRFPGRSFDLGVAEQNACGFSAGLAAGGKRPFVSAIAPFITGRCYEQIRNDIVRTRLPVAITGRGAGMSYSTGGPTHNAIDDMGLLRVLPGIVIVDPGDFQDFRQAMLCAAKLEGPIYIRKHKPLIKQINPDGYVFELGKGVVLKEGHTVTIVACGTMVYQAVLAADILAKHGISAGVVNMHTIKPIDEALIYHFAAVTEYMVTVEEHSIYNGLGSAVSEVLAQSGSRVRQLKIGLNDAFPTDGPYNEVLDYHGLTGHKIAKRISALIGHEQVE